MSDSITKWHEMQEDNVNKGKAHRMYPGDNYVTTSTNDSTYIYESPDGGRTIFQRPFGGSIEERETIKESYKPDSIVQEAIDMFSSRAEKGLETYGTTMDRDDLSLEQWLEHAIEEQADNLLYLIKALKELKKG